MAEKGVMNRVVANIARFPGSSIVAVGGVDRVGRSGRALQDGQRRGRCALQRNDGQQDQRHEFSDDVEHPPILE